MTDWNSLTDTEKMERLGNLVEGKVYSVKAKTKMAGGGGDGGGEGKESPVVRALKAAKPGKSSGYVFSKLFKSYHVGDLVIVLFLNELSDDPPKWYKGTIRSIRGEERNEYYVVFEDGDEKWIKYRNNSIRSVASAPRSAAKRAAEPGESSGYVFSHLFKRYHVGDLVIVLFLNDRIGVPPKWYKGTIRSIRGEDWRRLGEKYYVVFDDGEEKWIPYRNNNIRRYFVNANDDGTKINPSKYPAFDYRNEAVNANAAVPVNAAPAAAAAPAEPGAYRPGPAVWQLEQMEFDKGGRRKTKKGRRKSRRKKRTKKKHRRKPKSKRRVKRRRGTRRR